GWPVSSVTLPDTAVCAKACTCTNRITRNANSHLGFCRVVIVNFIFSWFNLIIGLFGLIDCSLYFLSYQKPSGFVAAHGYFPGCKIFAGKHILHLGVVVAQAKFSGYSC